MPAGSSCLSCIQLFFLVPANSGPSPPLTTELQTHRCGNTRLTQLPSIFSRSISLAVPHKCKTRHLSLNKWWPLLWSSSTSASPTPATIKQHQIPVINPSVLTHGGFASSLIGPWQFLLGGQFLLEVVSTLPGCSLILLLQEAFLTPPWQLQWDLLHSAL